MKVQDIPVREEQSLFEVQQKLYPRAVSGWFAGWRWSLVWATQLVFYGGCWLTWNGRQALLFDIAHRKFYLLGLVFWPQDVVYLAVLLIVSALSLFLFTAIAGRLWCGYACPQTVYTEIFLWIERKVEGDRNARMRLDQAGFSNKKLLLKGMKHALWIAVAFWTGITFVGYFTPIRELLSSAPGPWEIFWVGFYGFATYGNAGWMREQVCKYMCPYARFQSAMFDKNTLIITYDAKRGEPRGKKAGKGDCVDCGICVQVCPTGIDIRDGLQYECIGCAACIDGCDQVMEKIGRPKRLIGYSHGRVLRTRVLVYSAILLAIVADAATALWLRVPLKVDVIRDRAAIAREVGEEVENVYRLQIMNTTEQPRTYEIYAEGLPGLHVAGAGLVSLDGASARMVPVKLRIGVGQAAPGTHPIAFIVTAPESPRETVREKSVFIVR